MSTSPDKSIAVLGGSSAFMPSLAAALAKRAGDAPRLDIRLYGRSSARTAVVAEFCERFASARGVAHRYRAVETIEQAVDGVAVVLNQVRIGGFAGRTEDAQLALQHDCPGDETIGPSGLAAACRSLPEVVEIARRVAAAAPDAWFVQSSNPMSMLLHGVTQHAGLRTFGLCELPQDTLEQALGLVGRSESTVEADYVGVNHQGWWTRVAERGVDLLPAIFDSIAGQPAPGFFTVDADVMRERQALPLPYLRFYEHREREVARQRSQDCARGQELDALAEQLREHYAQSTDGQLPVALERRSMPWNDMAIAPVLVALLGGPEAEVFVTEPNRGYLSFLADDAMVEKHSTVGVAGPRPRRQSVPDVPDWLQAQLSAIADFEHAGARAAWTGALPEIQAALEQHPFGLGSERAGELATRITAAASTNRAAAR